MSAPQNRNPESDEIQSCYPFLLKQIHAIEPQIICALELSQLKPFSKRTPRFQLSVGNSTKFRDHGIPYLSPAYLLRNPERKREVWEI